MHGWLVVNGFLQSDKFSQLYAYLQAAASLEGIRLECLSSHQLYALDEGELFRGGKPDFVLFWDKDYPLAKRLEQLGLRLFNTADAMRACDDKMLTALALHGKAATPKTLFAPKTFEGVGYTDLSFLDEAERQLSYPMVVKEAFGSFGRQVYLVRSRKELERTVLALDYKPFLLQEFIAESAGRDVRINVVGGKVFCAILRENAGDFRSNITGGGKGVAYEPTPAEAEIALAACRALGLDYGGVDVLFGKDGPLVCEVNSNPHFKSTYDCTGLDMSVAIMRYVKGETV